MEHCKWCTDIAVLSAPKNCSGGWGSLEIQIISRLLAFISLTMLWMLNACSKFLNGIGDKPTVEKFQGFSVYPGRWETVSQEEEALPFKFSYQTLNEFRSGLHEHLVYSLLFKSLSTIFISFASRKSGSVVWSRVWKSVLCSRWVLGFYKKSHIERNKNVLSFISLIRSMRAPPNTIHAKSGTIRVLLNKI